MLSGKSTRDDGLVSLCSRRRTTKEILAGGGGDKKINSRIGIGKNGNGVKHPVAK